MICQLGRNGSEYTKIGIYPLTTRVAKLKRGIYGVYRNVSKKYLQAYIDEYSWRYNNRKYQDKMFDRLLGEIANMKVLKSPRKMVEFA